MPTRAGDHTEHGTRVIGHRHAVETCALHRPKWIFSVTPLETPA